VARLWHAAWQGIAGGEKEAITSEKEPGGNACSEPHAQSGLVKLYPVVLTARRMLGPWHGCYDAIGNVNGVVSAI
jgi:hypothetical protein